MSEERRSLSEAIGRFEIGTGVLVFVFGTLSPMISRFYPALEPDVLFGIWPLVLLLTGALMVLSGGRLLGKKKWPWAFHVPLVAWVVFVVFYLLQ